MIRKISTHFYDIRHSGRIPRTFAMSRKGEKDARIFS